MKKRNTTIDLLRVIGILFVIASHCGFSTEVNDLISFDVVLLVFVAGISFMMSSFDLQTDSYWEYVIKRFKKLVLPTWILIGVLLMILKVVFHEEINGTYILKSFLLLAGGLNYVWIYRVYFTSSLLIPFFKNLIKEKNPWFLLCVFLVITVANDLLHHYAFITMGIVGKVLEYLVTYTIGYLVITLIGMLNIRFTQKEKLLETLLFLGIAFLGRYLYGPLWTTYKHPPYLMYSSYGLSVSLFLYVVLSKVELKGFPEKFITWFSKNARSIYLWHALFCYVFKYLNMDVSPVVYWLILIGLSITGAYVEYKLIGIWRKNKNNG